MSKLCNYLKTCKNYVGFFAIESQALHDSRTKMLLLEPIENKGLSTDPIGILTNLLKSGDI